MSQKLIIKIFRSISSYDTADTMLGMWDPKVDNVCTLPSRTAWWLRRCRNCCHRVFNCEAMRACAVVMEPVRTEQRQAQKLFQNLNTGLVGHWRKEDGIRDPTRQLPKVCVAVAKCYKDKGALWQGDVGSTGLNKEKPASLVQEFPDCNVFMWGVHHQEEREHTAFLQCGLGTLICLLIYSVVLALYPEDTQKCCWEVSIPREWLLDCQKYWGC